MRADRSRNQRPDAKAASTHEQEWHNVRAGPRHRRFHWDLLANRSTDLDFGHHRRRKAGGARRTLGRQSSDNVSERGRSKELELDGVLAAHRLYLRAHE